MDGHAAGKAQGRGEERVVEGQEREDRGPRAERPSRGPAGRDRVEHRPRDERRGDEVADVERDDVPVGPRPQPFGHEGERDRGDRRCRRKDEHGGEDGREREVRALVPGSVGSQEMCRDDGGDEHAEGDSVAPLDVDREGEPGQESHRRQAERELEPCRRPAEAARGWMVIAPHVTPRTESSARGEGRESPARVTDHSFE